MSVTKLPGQRSATDKPRDNDGLHRRRGVWHYKLKVGGRWREFSTRTSNYQEARRIRQQALQAQEEGRLPTDMAKGPFERGKRDSRDSPRVVVNFLRKGDPFRAPWAAR